MSRMPALFLSHGAPPLVDDARWVAQLRDLADGLPRPTAILMASAHWESAPLMLGATSTVPLVYDFGGFERRYYEVQYPAPGAPGLAERIEKLMPDGEHVARTNRGLDHGADVPLTVMYPGADIPVLQMSLPTLEPDRLLDLGRRLAPLRDEGVLIIGSGFTTHGPPVLRPRRACRSCATGGPTRPLPAGPASSTRGRPRRWPAERSTSWPISASGRPACRGPIRPSSTSRRCSSPWARPTTQSAPRSSRSTDSGWASQSGRSRSFSPSVRYFPV